MAKSDEIDVLVVGAGAAGLLAATMAARAGARVRLLESAKRPGAKIRVSGGGRCNVLPSVASEKDFHTSGSIRRVRNVLRTWPLEEVHRHFERHLRIPLKVEDTGKVFPVSDQSKDVVDALLRDLGASGAELVAGTRVMAIERLGGDPAGAWRVTTADGERFEAPALILTTGGQSLPKTGSDGAGYGFARKLGHSIRPLQPALVPLKTAAAHWADLAGLALPAELEVREQGKVAERFSGDFLFTHRGFSGPVALDASRRLTHPERPADTQVTACWLAAAAPDWNERLRPGGGSSVTVGAILRDALPRRLADHLAAQSGVATGTRLADLPKTDRRELVRWLEASPLEVNGDEGYAKAEVTAGGVPLEELHGATLESRLAPGLYFAGEVLDVVGRLGGFNFLWAWASGRLAGESAARAAAPSRSSG